MKKWKSFMGGYYYSTTDYADLPTDLKVLIEKTIRVNFNEEQFVSCIWKKFSEGFILITHKRIIASKKYGKIEQNYFSDLTGIEKESALNPNIVLLSSSNKTYLFDKTQVPNDDLITELFVFLNEKWRDVKNGKNNSVTSNGSNTNTDYDEFKQKYQTAESNRIRRREVNRSTKQSIKRYIYAFFCIFFGLILMVQSFFGGFLSLCAGVIVFPFIDKKIKKLPFFPQFIKVKYISFALLFLGFFSSVLTVNTKKASNNVETEIKNEQSEKEADIDLRNKVDLAKVQWKTGFSKSDIIGEWYSLCWYSENKPNEVYYSTDEGEDIKKLVFTKLTYQTFFSPYDENNANPLMHYRLSNGRINVVLKGKIETDIFNYETKLSTDKKMLYLKDHDIVKIYSRDNLAEDEIKSEESKDEIKEKNKGDIMTFEESFWKNYDPSVKTRIKNLIEQKNCNELQKEFELLSKNDKAQRNFRGEGNARLMIFIDEAMRELGCYE